MASLLIAALIFTVVGRRKQRPIRPVEKQLDSDEGKKWTGMGRRDEKNGYRTELDAGMVAHEMATDMRKVESWTRNGP